MFVRFIHLSILTMIWASFSIHWKECFIIIYVFNPYLFIRFLFFFVLVRCIHLYYCRRLHKQLDWYLSWLVDHERIFLRGRTIMGTAATATAPTTTTATATVTCTTYTCWPSSSSFSTTSSSTSTTFTWRGRRHGRRRKQYEWYV